MKFFIAIILAVIVIVSGGQSERVSAQAAATYTFEFSSTNLYGNDGELSYHFTGLDSAADYIWLLQGFDESLGGYQALGTIFGVGGATFETIKWDANDGDFDLGDGAIFSGPARVIDNFGNVLGTHFISSGCSQNFLFECTPVYCWIDTCTANNGPTDRVIIGTHANDNVENVDGWFHDYTSPNTVLTTVGDYTLLHYRYPPGACVWTDEIRLYRIESPTVVQRFEICDFYDYNTDINNSVLTPWFPQSNFVVLNTTGDHLEFINEVQDRAAFQNATAGDNPHETLLTPGAYDYVHTTSVGAIVADGESVLLVASEHGSEWGIKTGQDEIVVSSIMHVELESGTEEIWDSTYNNHDLSDSLLGSLDTDDYVFLNRRSYNFTVDSAPGSGVLTWTITPTDGNDGFHTLSDMRFDIDLAYELISDFTTSNRVEMTLNGLGMDTPLGRSLALLGIMGAGMIMAATAGARGLVPFSLIYIATGGAWMALGMGDTLTLLIYGISAVLLLYILANSRESVGE